jgi:hypothetical protein
MEKLAREKEKWGRFAELSPDVIGAFGQIVLQAAKKAVYWISKRWSSSVSRWL